MATITLGLDTIMPAKQAKVHINDSPCITAEFKRLVHLRQRAFHSADAERFRYYRNFVNRERKSLRSKYFASKVQHLKHTKPN